MTGKTRVRFAPSPTGPLHMGGVRTALYNYLFAKQRGGAFILRIEDTDSQRFVPGAEQYIIEALAWCGITPDEGVEDGKIVETPSPKHPHAPYRQSQRKPLYRQYAEQLVASGNAYYAFDSAAELAARRSSDATFIYNRQTRLEMRNSLTLPAEEVAHLLEATSDWTIRFKMPEDRVVEMDDLIRGHIEVNTSTLDDKVLWKRADELPTYHLANIVDDHLMKISEVIRGEEWLPSLPLHYLLYEAFGWERPGFAHLSLLLKPDGKGKLSKRDGDKLGFPVFPLRWTSPSGEVSRGYREDGYFPEAFVNLLAFLGWNPGTEQEIFSLRELVSAFSLDRIVKSGARFNPDKAHWYNREYLRMKSSSSLTDLYIPLLEAHGLEIVSDAPAFMGAGDRPRPDFRTGIFPRSYVEAVVSLIRERATFVADFWTIAPYLFVAPASYNEKDRSKFWKEENYTLALQAASFVESISEPWTHDSIGTALEEYIRSNGWPMGKVMNCLRLALAGVSSGLGIADILVLIGRNEFAYRIENIRKTLC